MSKEDKKAIYENFIKATDSQLMLGLHISGIVWQPLHSEVHTCAEIKQADELYIQNVYAFLDDAKLYVDLTVLTIMSVFLCINIELDNNYVRSIMIHRLMPEGFKLDESAGARQLRKLMFCRANGLIFEKLLYSGVGYRDDLDWMREYWKAQRLRETERLENFQKLSK